MSDVQCNHTHGLTAVHGWFTRWVRCWFCDLKVFAGWRYPLQAHTVSETFDAAHNRGGMGGIDTSTPASWTRPFAARPEGDET